MDSSDPSISFDGNGVCNHCHRRDDMISRFVFDGEAGKIALDKNVAKIKKEGIGKDYDCIMGVSGGVDSSYVTYIVKKLGLRPLAIHLDNGWDSELAVKNIELLMTKLGYDLYTEVLDWEQFRDLQLSFLKASTPDSEIPSDHAIAAILRHKAEELGVSTVIIGTNYRTESHLPIAWSYGAQDWRYIHAVHSTFGSAPLRGFPHYDAFQNWIFKVRLRSFPILNYLDYNKTIAIDVLEKEIGWKYYGQKHYESIYTRFFQGYILPKKFGFDKRRAHYSSLICSGEITRERALQELEKPPYPLDRQESDKQYVIKKLGIGPDEFERIMSLPPKTYHDYPNYNDMNFIVKNKELFTILQQANRKMRLVGQ